MDPSVSVPTEAAQRHAAVAAPEPELEPLGLRSSTYGLRVCKPRPLQPLTERDERKFAHSLRFVLPRMTTPASRNLLTIGASWLAKWPSSASEPAVVIMRSPVSMLSLTSSGMPWSGPRDLPARSSRSSDSAMSAPRGSTRSPRRDAARGDRARQCAQGRVPPGRVRSSGRSSSRNPVHSASAPTVRRSRRSATPERKCARTRWSLQPPERRES
jgi:hypothetical protein